MFEKRAFLKNNSQCQRDNKVIPFSSLEKQQGLRKEPKSKTMLILRVLIVNHSCIRMKASVYLRIIDLIQH